MFGGFPFGGGYFGQGPALTTTAVVAPQDIVTLEVSFHRMVTLDAQFRRTVTAETNYRRLIGLVIER